MPTSAPQDYSDLLLRLYGLSHEQTIEGFQDDALRLLQSIVPFDASMWGTARTSPAGIDVHTLHLFRKSPDMMAEYEAVKHQDSAAASLMNRQRGTVAVHGPTWHGRREERDIGQFLSRWKQNNNILTADNDVERRFVHWISLFRADPDQQCQPHELQLVHQLAPHLMQGLAINRRVHLQQRHPQSSVPCGTAIADLRGVIYHADAAFREMLRTEWPGWNGHTLPDPALTDFLQGQARHLGGTAVLNHHAEHGLLFLKSRRRCPADDLTPSEFRVAQLTAKGNTHKQVAALLQRSPATVRNQLQSAYDKLGVGHVAQLVEALRAAE